jgi:serine-type D-Ala-D-Ala carboxypeptidase (penicillin-binding protein 5/6)
VIAQRLMREFPQYMGYYAIKKYRYAGTPEANDSNRNLLLFRDASVDGLKTGHTEAAGYCLVATAKRSFANLGAGGQAGERRLLSVMLGTSSENARANESQKLLNWGYTAFDAVKLFDANQVVLSPKVWKGTLAEAKLGSDRALVVAVPAGDAAKLKTEVQRPDPLVAPLAKGQPVGQLNVSINGREVAKLPLVALEDVPQTNWFGRSWDAVRLWIK